jgi:hypothetical protein
MKPAAPATRTRKDTIRRKSLLMTMHLMDYEKVIGRRITIELLRSPEYREHRDKFVSLFMPLLREQEERKI